METSTIIIGFVAGTIGFGYFVYGKKQSRVVPMISGAGLMFIPYLVEDWLILLLVCVVLLLLPFVIKS